MSSLAVKYRRIPPTGKSSLKPGATEGKQRFHLAKQLRVSRVYILVWTYDYSARDGIVVVVDH